MSSMLHLLPDGDGFARRLQRAQLDWLVSSESASRSLAENYVGLPVLLERVGRVVRASGRPRVRCRWLPCPAGRATMPSRRQPSS